ncbi:MAG: polysaccharide biosynthesis C-terminal domain-containing protein, partial [Desulfobacteraceae bacterium]|nr:polysaccharide biosynthesis C-terminal domain-containing protein [Desulfobacteraceae bacterium]
PAIPLVQVLAIYGMILSISAVTGPIFKAIGKPNILFYTSLNHHIILVISLILLRDYGVIGICYALLIPVVISALIAFIIIRKLLHIHWIELIIPIIKPGLAAAIMFIMVKAFQNHSLLTILLSPVLKLTVLIMIGALTYTLTSICLNRTLFKDFRYTVFEIIKSKGKVT